MIIEPKTIELKDGRKCVLRNACATDAVQMINYLKVSASETEFILRYPDEVQYTEESEAEILEKNKANPHSVFQKPLQNSFPFSCKIFVKFNILVN